MSAQSPCSRPLMSYSSHPTTPSSISLHIDLTCEEKADATLVSREPAPYELSRAMEGTQSFCPSRSSVPLTATGNTHPGGDSALQVVHAAESRQLAPTLLEEGVNGHSITVMTSPAEGGGFGHSCDPSDNQACNTTMDEGKDVTEVTGAASARPVVAPLLASEGAPTQGSGRSVAPCGGSILTDSPQNLKPQPHLKPSSGQGARCEWPTLDESQHPLPPSRSTLLIDTHCLWQQPTEGINGSPPVTGDSPPLRRPFPALSHPHHSDGDRRGEGRCVGEIEALPPFLSPSQGESARALVSLPFNASMTGGKAASSPSQADIHDLTEANNVVKMRSPGDNVLCQRHVLNLSPLQSRSEEPLFLFPLPSHPPSHTPPASPNNSPPTNLLLRNYPFLPANVPPALNEPLCLDAITPMHASQLNLKATVEAGTVEEGHRGSFQGGHEYGGEAREAATEGGGVQEQRTSDYSAGNRSAGGCEEQSKGGYESVFPDARMRGQGTRVSGHVSGVSCCGREGGDSARHSHEGEDRGAHFKSDKAECEGEGLSVEGGGMECERDCIVPGRHQGGSGAGGGGKVGGGRGGGGGGGGDEMWQSKAEHERWHQQQLEHQKYSDGPFLQLPLQATYTPPALPPPPPLPPPLPPPPPSTPSIPMILSSELLHFFSPPELESVATPSSPLHMPAVMAPGPQALTPPPILAGAQHAARYPEGDAHSPPSVAEKQGPHGWLILPHMPEADFTGNHGRDKGCCAHGSGADDAVTMGEPAAQGAGADQGMEGEAHSQMRTVYVDMAELSTSEWDARHDAGPCRSPSKEPLAVAAAAVKADQEVYLQRNEQYYEEMDADWPAAFASLSEGVNPGGTADVEVSPSQRPREDMPVPLNVVASFLPLQGSGADGGIPYEWEGAGREGTGGGANAARPREKEEGEEEWAMVPLGAAEQVPEGRFQETSANEWLGGGDGKGDLAAAWDLKGGGSQHDHDDNHDNGGKDGKDCKDVEMSEGVGGGRVDDWNGWNAGSGGGALRAGSENNEGGNAWGEDLQEDAGRGRGDLREGQAKKGLEEDEEEEELWKGLIASHDKFPQLLESHVACLKVML